MRQPIHWLAWKKKGTICDPVFVNGRLLGPVRIGLWNWKIRAVDDDIGKAVAVKYLKHSLDGTVKYAR